MRDDQLNEVYIENEMVATSSDKIIFSHFLNMPIRKNKLYRTNIRDINILCNIFIKLIMLISIRLHIFNFWIGY